MTFSALLCCFIIIVLLTFFCVQKIQILCIFCSRQKEIMFSQFVLFGLGDYAEAWSQFSGINGTVMDEDHHFQFILKKFFWG